MSRAAAHVRPGGRARRDRAAPVHAAGVPQFRPALRLSRHYSVMKNALGDLLAQRGITVSYEAIRQWCRRFGPEYARRLRRRQGHLSDTWYLDELFVSIRGRQQYLWRAVDQDGDVIDILVQQTRDRFAAVPGPGGQGATPSHSGSSDYRVNRCYRLRKQSDRPL